MGPDLSLAVNNPNPLLFDSLVEAVRPKMVHLYGLLDAYPFGGPRTEAFHPWDRPGLGLVPSRLPSNSYRWDIEGPSGEGLSVSRRRSDDRTISLWLGRQQGTVPPFILDVDKPYAMQDPRTQCRLTRLFGQAGVLLDLAAHAIEHGCPMKPGVSWDEHLSQRASTMVGFLEHAQFKHWVFTWGSVQTQAVWTITNTLHDAEHQFEDWKAAFVQGLRAVHAPTLERMDTDVFGQ